MLRIALTQNQFAVIDDEDFELISQYKWYAVDSPVGFYAMTKTKWPDGRRRNLSMQRLLTGDPPGLMVDHWNHDTLDNRRKNLRVATRGQNKANGHASSYSGYKGVYPTTGSSTWTAQIRYSGRTRHVGNFRSAEEAARAYDARAREIHGEFAFLNFPES